MADYYPLLAKAVSGLPDSTPEARQAVYERARRALYGQLRNLDPPVPEDAIEREAQSLERAVAQIETELTARSSPESDKLPSGTDFSGLGPPVGPMAPPREPRRPLPSASAPTGTDMPGPAAKRTLASPLPPRTPIKVRRDPPGAAPSAWPIRPPRPGSAAHPAGPLPRSGPGDSPVPFSAPKPPSSREGTQGQAPVQPPVSEETSGARDTPFVETFAPEAIAPGDGSYEPSSMRLEAQHPFAPHAERDRSAAKRVGIVVGIVGLVVVLVAAAAYRLRDRPEDLVRLQPSALVQGEAAPGGKIVDRVDTGTATPGSPATSSTGERTEAAKAGAESGNPAIPVARRAALLMEAPEEQSKVKTVLGTVVWRVDNVSNGPDEPLSMAVRAEVDIPNANLQAAMVIQKNFDSSLPASHTIKLNFSVPAASPLANIKQVSVLMRREDTPTGEALTGITVPVTENSFLIGLSRGTGEATNLELLRSREWFDIPIVLANGHIAKLTFEKGPSGRIAIDDAMASWQAR
ncbi:MAG TPA: hypothetical protein VIE66_15040 [Methylocella sp.]